MKSPSPRLVLALLCGVAVIIGALLGQDGPLRPRFGVTLAVVAFVSGASLGVRGYVPVYLGIAAYAIARVASYTPPATGGDSPAGALILGLTIIPAYYVIPSLAGVLARPLLIAILRRI